MDIKQHINTEEIAERLDHDINLLRELVSLFISDSTTILGRIKSSIDRGDSAALRKEAHTLKGSVSNFSAYRAYELALELEKLGREGDLDESAEKFALLGMEIENVREALIALAKAHQL